MMSPKRWHLEIFRVFSVNFITQTSVTLPRGAFSVVKKAVHKTTNAEFAAKIFNTRRLTARGILYCYSLYIVGKLDKRLTYCP